MERQQKDEEEKNNEEQEKLQKSGGTWSDLPHCYMVTTFRYNANVIRYRNGWCS